MYSVNKIIIALVLSSIFVSCAYEDYETDFEYSTVYFSRQVQTRNFVYGEDLDIQIGVVMGGKRKNLNNEWVKYVIDTTLITNSALKLLPKSYYSISDSMLFKISKNSFEGRITIMAKPEFFNDPLSVTGKYVLPLRLVDSSIDSILATKNTLLLTLKFEQSLFGVYYRNGKAEQFQNNNYIKTIYYHQEVPVTNSLNLASLTTYQKDTLSCNLVGDISSGAKMRISLSVFPSEVMILPHMQSSVSVTPNGKSYYNGNEKSFYLKYKYVKSGYTYEIVDTLLFRNRILDGVNQWR